MKSRIILQQGLLMEGKVIKEESLSVGSPPCSPAPLPPSQSQGSCPISTSTTATTNSSNNTLSLTPNCLPSGKENRRVGSPLNTSEILTRSRSKGQSTFFCFKCFFSLSGNHLYSTAIAPFSIKSYLNPVILESVCLLFLLLQGIHRILCSPLLSIHFRPCISSFVYIRKHKKAHSLQQTRAFLELFRSYQNVQYGNLTPYHSRLIYLSTDNNLEKMKMNGRHSFPEIRKIVFSSVLSHF